MNNELISIIIPVYNVGLYIRKCLDSVIAQTYRNLEIILIDDGSTDASPQICDEYARKDSRIKVIHKMNEGQGIARNVGIDFCNGIFVGFVDADDFISPYYYEIMYHALKKDGTQMCVLATETAFWDGNDESAIHLAQNADDYNKEIRTNIDVMEKMFYMMERTGAPFKLFRKELWTNVRFPAVRAFEDMATTYLPMMKVEYISVIHSNLYAYRKRDSSTTRRAFSDDKLCAIKIAEELLENINIFNKELLPSATVRAYALIFNVFLLVPKADYANQQKLWNYIKSYRKSILQNKSKYMRKKDKIAAVISYLGMHITYCIGKEYTKKEKYKN